MSSKPAPPAISLVSARNGATVLAVRSPVFQKTEAGPFEDAVARLKKKKNLRCVLDLSRCEYVSSEGLGMIARLWRYCHDQKAGCLAVVLSPAHGNEVRHLFETIGLSRIMGSALLESMDEAMRFLQKKSGWPPTQAAQS